jgi:hypothetical protein
MQGIFAFRAGKKHFACDSAHFPPPSRSFARSSGLVGFFVTIAQKVLIRSRTHFPGAGPSPPPSLHNSPSTVVVVVFPGRSVASTTSVKRGPG